MPYVDETKAINISEIVHLKVVRTGKHPDKYEMFQDIHLIEEEVSHLSI